MFDKFRARVERLEETNDDFRKVMTHLRENKRVYYVGAGTLAFGFIGGKHFQRPIEVIIENAPTFNNTVAPVMNNIGNHLTNNVGHCCKIVQDLDDPDKLWPKVNALAAELAAEHNISFDAARSMLSKHLNGHSNDVFGKHYVTYGLGTTG